jgi:hypothetical protein
VGGCPNQPEAPIIVFWSETTTPSVFASRETALMFVGDDSEVVQGSEVFDSEGRRLVFQFQEKRSRFGRTAQRLDGLVAVDSDPARLFALLRPALESDGVITAAEDALLASLVERAASVYLVD